MSSSQPIALDDVRLDGADGPILNGVTAQLIGRSVAIVGENGSGKSTLTRVIAGLADADRGEVDVHGMNPARERKAIRAHVGLIMSNPAAQILLPTVREDIGLSLQRLGLKKQEQATRVDAIMRHYGLDELADRAAHTLSSGQQQLLALAAVMVARPRLLIADEPTTLLDRRNARMIARALLDADADQVVIATHDLDLAERCEQGIWMRDGAVEASGSAAEVARAYRDWIDQHG